LTLEFPKKPLVIDGYAIQTADEGIDPIHWDLLITEVNIKGQNQPEKIIDE
jgi:hypothetical protein